MSLKLERMKKNRTLSCFLEGREVFFYGENCLIVEGGLGNVEGNQGNVEGRL